MSDTVEPGCSTATGRRIPRRIGSDGFGAAEPLHELVADVAGREVGEDEDVGIALDTRVRVVLLRDLLDDSRVNVHLTVDNQVRPLLARTSWTARATRAASG